MNLSPLETCLPSLVIAFNLASSRRCRLYSFESRQCSITGGKRGRSKTTKKLDLFFALNKHTKVYVPWYNKHNTKRANSHRFCEFIIRRPSIHTYVISIPKQRHLWLPRITAYHSGNGCAIGQPIVWQLFVAQLWQIVTYCCWQFTLFVIWSEMQVAFEIQLRGI